MPSARVFTTTNGCRRVVTVGGGETSAGGGTTGQPPSATTQAVTTITGTTCTLNGVVNPNGLSTTVRFVYGRQGTGKFPGSTQPVDVGAGFTAQNVHIPLTDLEPTVRYSCKLSASNSAGNAQGDVANWTQGVGSPPAVSSGAASNITETSATLNGNASPGATDAQAWFKWRVAGSSDTYTESPIPHIDVPADSIPVAVSTDIFGLSGGITYEFFITAANLGGQVDGALRTFTTSPATVAPDVTTGAASSITTTTATLNGIVLPGGQTTSVRFEWGISDFSNIAPVPDVSGTDAVPFSAPLSGLTPDIDYQFRAAASNGDGSDVGLPATFHTNAIPVQPPATISGLATTTITQTTCGFTVNVNPNGGTTFVSFVVRRPTGALIWSGSTTNIGNGSTNVVVTDTATGLPAGANLIVTCFAVNGSQATDAIGFNTLSGIPTVANVPAATVTDTTAVLQATVDPNGFATQVWFEWGLGTALDQSTTFTTINGDGDQLVTFQLTNLTPDATYVFRAVAQNSQTDTPVFAPDVLGFTMASAPGQPFPIVNIQPPINVTATTATFVADVNPQGAQTDVYFELRDTIGTVLQTTATQDVGSGTLLIQVFDSVSGLTALTDYVAFVSATNSGGQSTGARGFQTAPSGGGTGAGTQILTYGIAGDVERNPMNTSLGFITEDLERDFTYTYSSVGLPGHPLWYHGLTYNCRIYERVAGQLAYQVRTGASIDLPSGENIMAQVIRRMFVGDVCAFETMANGDAMDVNIPSTVIIGGGGTVSKHWASWPGNRPVGGIGFIASDPTKKPVLRSSGRSRIIEFQSGNGGWNGIHFKNIRIWGMGTATSSSAIVFSADHNPGGMVGFYDCNWELDTTQTWTQPRPMRCNRLAGVTRMDYRRCVFCEVFEQFIYADGPNGLCGGAFPSWVIDCTTTGTAGRSAMQIVNRYWENEPYRGKGVLLIKGCTFDGGMFGAHTINITGFLGHVRIEGCTISNRATPTAGGLIQAYWPLAGGPCGTGNNTGYNHPQTEADGYACHKITLKGNIYDPRAGTSDHIRLSSVREIEIYDDFVFLSGNKAGYDFENEDFGSASMPAGSPVMNCGSPQYSTQFASNTSNGIIKWIQTDVTAPASVAGWAGLSGAKIKHLAGGSAANDTTFSANQINGVTAPPTGCNYVVVNAIIPFTAAGAHFRVNPTTGNSHIWCRVCRTGSGWAFAYERSGDTWCRFYTDTLDGFGALTPQAAYATTSVNVSNQPLGTGGSENSDEPDISCDLAHDRVLVCHNDRTNADHGLVGSGSGDIMGIFGRTFDGDGIAQSPTISHFLNSNPDYSQWRAILNPNYIGSGGWAIGFTIGPGTADSAACFVTTGGVVIAPDTRLHTADSSHKNGDVAVATNSQGYAIATYHVDDGGGSITVNHHPHNPANGTNTDRDIQFRLINSITGAVLGPEQAFNSASTMGDSENEMRIQSNAGGSTFWLVWNRGPGPQYDGRSVWAAQLTPNTTLNNVSTVVQPFQVSGPTAQFAGNCEVAVDGAGRATIVWRELVGSWYVIKARAFHANGNPDGVEWQVSPAGATIHYYYPDVSTKTDGSRIVIGYGSMAADPDVHPDNSGGAPNKNVYAIVYDRI